MHCLLLVHVQIKLNVLTLFGQRNLFCCLTWKLGDDDCCLGFIPSNKSRWMDSDNHWTSSVRREGEREREREGERKRSRLERKTVTSVHVCSTERSIIMKRTYSYSYSYSTHAHKLLKWASVTKHTMDPCVRNILRSH